MVAIIGAGISGLSLAYYLEKRNIPYKLIEASNKVGGLIDSTKIDNYLLETGPNSILCDDFLLEFLKSIGLEKDFIYPNSASNNRYIYKNGKYRKLPDNPVSLLTSSFFSLKTKIAILKEFNTKPEVIQDETLAHFFERRFSKEVVDYALNPFISGIYAGDPEKLLLNKTFPSLIEFEQNQGSILKGFIKNKTGSRKLSLNFKNGMEQLPKAIAGNLKHILLNTRIEDLQKNDTNQFIVTTNHEAMVFDKVVFTCSAHATATILKNYTPIFAASIQKIEYPPMSAVYSAFNKTDVGLKLNGFGGLNPKIENQFCAGSIWTSSIMPERCPKDQVLFTSFIGGAQYTENTTIPDEEIKQKTSDELRRQYHIQSAPVFQYIKKWPSALPQYTAALNVVYTMIEQLEKDNIYFSTNWHNGVSLGDCIKKGEALAKRL
jgi:oxygen-dependent protoporphyrinogen oxidase